MRDYAGMARKQLRTSNYPDEARAALGVAVETARLAAGYKYRTDFCRAHGIRNLRGLELLEQGRTGVGQAFLFEVADALPNWDRETPRIILEGGPVPATAGPTDLPTDMPDDERRFVEGLIDQDFPADEVLELLERLRARKRKRNEIDHRQTGEELS